MNTINIDGAPYEVFQTFGINRCLIRFEGLAVLADKEPITGAWILSGIPATPEEEKIVEMFMPTDEMEIVYDNK